MATHSELPKEIVLDDRAGIAKSGSAFPISGRLALNFAVSGGPG